MKKYSSFCHILLLSIVLLAAFSFGSCKSKAKVEAPQTTVFSASHVSPGKAVPGLEAYRIAYYEAVQGEGAAGAIQESNEPFKVVDYGPAGELPSEIKKPSIYVVFSQPVVPLARLGEVLREDAGFFAIEPALKGVYRWYGTRLLSFEPDGESMPQREYKVTVSDSIKSLGGKSLEGDRSFSFATERLKVLDWQLGTGETWVRTWDADPVDAKYMSLVFSYPVNLGEIAKWIQVSAAGQTFPFTLTRLPKIDEKRYSPEQGALLTLSGSLPPDTDVVLRVLAGARSEAGWLGSKEDAVYTFHTIRPFKLDGVSVRSAARPRTEEGDTIPIALEFSHTVDPETSPSLFSVEGMPAPLSGGLKKENVHFYGSTVVINRLPLEYEKNYQVHV
ncbi:MAG: alpha-2-macroglobulin, partial [Treponema sp.]|nr:alpha-2-macroglobulin [Treponema sp.]